MSQPKYCPQNRSGVTCGALMSQVQYEGVVIDICPEEETIVLDPSELAKIVDFSLRKHGVQPQPRRSASHSYSTHGHGHGHGDHGHGHGHKKHHDSFLEDFFESDEGGYEGNDD